MSKLKSGLMILERATNIGVMTTVPIRAMIVIVATTVPTRSANRCSVRYSTSIEQDTFYEAIRKMPLITSAALQI